MLKRVFSVLVLALVLVSCFAVLPVGAEAAWDGKTANSFESGKGFKDDPYIISNASQLALLSGSVSSGNPHKGEYFKLSADIVLNNTDELTWYQNAVKWIPIGNPNTAFEGIFDGNGKTVKGIYIECDTDAQGLFGVVGSGGKVVSLTVDKTSVSGNTYVGGIAGINNGDIINCRNIDAIRAVSDGGGIVGLNNGRIAGCVNGGWVGNKGNNGGIAGRNDGEITDCYNYGAIDGGYLVAGGVVGENRGTVKNCYNVGYIVSEYGKSGSIAGFNGGGTVDNCYYLDRGSDLDKDGTLLTSDDMKASASFKGFDFENIWTMEGEEDYLYPELRGKTDFYADSPVPPSDVSADGSFAESGKDSDTSSDGNNAVVWITVIILLVLAGVIVAISLSRSNKAK